MKLLKGRKLLKKPKQIESRKGKIWRKIRHFFAEIFRRKVFIFNLIVLLATAGYAVKYYLDRDEVKQQEAQAQAEKEAEGERLRDIFFNSVYEEEMAAQREQEEAEERRKASIAAATEDTEEVAVEDNQEVTSETNQNGENSEVAIVEEVEEEVYIDPTVVLEQIEKEQDQEFPTYQNKTYKYTLKYPPNWFLDKETKSDSWLAYVTSYDPAGKTRSDLPSSPRLEILVQSNIRNLTLDEWMEEGYKYNGEPQESKKVKVADIDAYRNTEINPYPAIVVTLMHDSNVYTITYVGGDITNEENIKILNFMLDNIKFN